MKRLAFLVVLAPAFTVATGPAAAIMVASPPLDPLGEARVRASLLRSEAELARRLRQTHGDPRIGVELGNLLYSRSEWNLEHPSPTVVQAIAAARDPAALALAIAGDQRGSYATDALLAALAVEPNETLLWREAARSCFDPAYRIVFLGRALDSLTPKGGAALSAPWVLPAAAEIAAERLAVTLRVGLAREAVADFYRLPAAIRERIAAGEVRAPGSDRAAALPPDDDLRPDIALASLVAGDDAGARALLARSPGPVLGAGGTRIYDLGPAVDPVMERTIAARWLAPPAPGDPFPMIAEIAKAGLLSRSGIDLIASALLAEREAYPAVAAFAWRRAAAELELAGDVYREDPVLAPTDLAHAAAALQVAIEAQARDARAAAAAATAAAGGPPGAVTVVARGTCSRFTFPAADVELFVLDRTGRRGLVLRSHGDSSGGYRIVEHGGEWLADDGYQPAGYATDLGRGCQPVGARN